MPRFVKRPVEVSAVRYYGEDNGPVSDALCYCRQEGQPTNPRPHLHTLEGVMKVSAGDWIITGVEGEKYPCKPDIFEKTYNRVPCERLDGQGCHGMCRSCR